MKHLRYCRYLPRSQATYTTVTEPIPSDQLAASAQWPGALPDFADHPGPTPRNHADVKA